MLTMLNRYCMGMAITISVFKHSCLSIVELCIELNRKRLHETFLFVCFPVCLSICSFFIIYLTAHYIQRSERTFWFVSFRLFDCFSLLASNMLFTRFLCVNGVKTIGKMDAFINVHAGQLSFSVKCRCRIDGESNCLQ